MINYSAEEINNAIQNFDTKFLEIIVTDVTSQVWDNIKTYIPYDIRFDKEFFQNFVLCTGIPQISLYKTTIDVISIQKDRNYFVCRFYQNEIGRVPTYIGEFGWKVKDFLNEQKWIDNINTAINQGKHILEYRIKRSQELLYELPQNELSVKVF